MSFSCQKGEFDRFFNRLDRPVEESRPDRQPDRCRSTRPVSTSEPPYSPDLAPCDFFLLPNSRKSSKELVFKIQKPLKQPWRESSDRSWKNPSWSAWKRGRGDWKSAFEPKEITLKATCCKIYLSNKIKHFRPSPFIFQTHLIPSQTLKE